MTENDFIVRCNHKKERKLRRYRDVKREKKEHRSQNRYKDSMREGI